MEKTFDNYTLRLLRREDLLKYFNLIDTNRKRLEDFFAGTVAITKTLEETEKHLEDVVSQSEMDNYFPFIVIDNNTHKIIASLQVKNIDKSIPKGELGYYIDEQYEGKGIISKMITLIIDFCFTHKKFNKLYIRTYEGNIASRKVAENNGFTLEGVLKCEYKTTNGTIVDLMYYGLVNPKYS